MGFFTEYKWAIELLAIIAFVIALFYGVHKSLQYEQNIGYDKAVAEYKLKLSNQQMEYEVQLLASQTSARNREQALSKQIEKAQNEAVIRDQQISKLTNSLDKSAGKLRDTITADNSKLDKASRDAAIAYAKALADVFGQCTDKYREMAETADKQQSDIDLLVNSWPK